MNKPKAAMALEKATLQLANAGVRGAARDARILLADAMKCDLSMLPVKLDHDLSPQQATRFTDSIAARRNRQPVAQIIGRREFWGHTFRVTPDVLDPRPDSETIIERAIRLPVPRRILDLGTGSGCLIVSLLREWPDAIAVATDISHAALSVAAFNAQENGVGDRLTLVHSDWFKSVGDTFDLIVCNPPYVSEQEFAGLEDDVRLWEPKAALTPGGDGLGAYRVLSAGLPGHLDAGGTALFEIGHLQGKAARAIFRRAGFGETWIHKDMDGRDRVLEIRQSGTKKTQTGSDCR